MADKKIVDLTALASQSATDLYETSLNGSGSRKETRAQQNAYWDANVVLEGTDQVTGLDDELDSIKDDIADRVVGPASSTDGAITLWDGLTGKLVKNSVFIPTVLPTPTYTIPLLRTRFDAADDKGGIYQPPSDNSVFSFDANTSFALENLGQSLNAANAEPVFFTIEAQADVAIPAGVWTEIIMTGGTVTGVPADGVTLRAPNGLSTNGAYDRVRFRRVSGNAWDWLVGSAVGVNVINVSNYGRDALLGANGTLSNPLSTIAEAIGYIDAFEIEAPVIKLDAGFYSVAELALMPNIPIDGAGMGLTQLEITGPGQEFTLSPDWDGISAYGRLSNLSLVDGTGINFDTTAMVAFGGRIDLINVEVSGNVLFTSKTGHTFTSQSSNNNFISPAIMTDIFEYRDQLSTYDSFQLNAITTNATAYLRNLAYPGIVSCVANSSPTATIYMTACGQSDQLEATGANASIIADAVSYITPNPSTGLVTLQTESSAVKAGFTPVNYTPTDDSVKGNLEGIDAALGSIVPPETPITFSAYQTPQQTIPNNSETTVEFKQTSWNDGGDFSTSTYEFTAPQAMQMSFAFKAAMAAPGGGDAQVKFRMYQNSTVVSEDNQIILMGELDRTFNLIKSLKLALNDTVSITCEVTGNGGSGLSIANTQSQTYFQGWPQSVTYASAPLFVNQTGTSATMGANTVNSANNGSLVTLTLPDSTSLDPGSFVEVLWRGAGGWKIAQNASDYIIFGDVVTTTGTGGYIQSSVGGVFVAGTNIRLVLLAAHIWQVTSSFGNLDYV